MLCWFIKITSIPYLHLFCNRAQVKTNPLNSLSLVYLSTTVSISSTRPWRSSRPQQYRRICRSDRRRLWFVPISTFYGEQEELTSFIEEVVKNGGEVSGRRTSLPLLYHPEFGYTQYKSNWKTNTFKEGCTGLISYQPRLLRQPLVEECHRGEQGLLPTGPSRRGMKGVLSTDPRGTQNHHLPWWRTVASQGSFSRRPAEDEMTHTDIKPFSNPKLADWVPSEQQIQTITAAREILDLVPTAGQHQCHTITLWTFIPSAPWGDGPQQDDTFETLIQTASYLLAPNVREESTDKTGTAPRFLRLAEVLEMTGMRKTFIYDRINDGLSKQIQLGSRTALQRAEVTKWMEDRMTQDDPDGWGSKYQQTLRPRWLDVPAFFVSKSSGVRNRLGTLREIA